jgi:putative transcriptional regulator
MQCIVDIPGELVYTLSHTWIGRNRQVKNLKMKAARVQKDLSQEELARKTGVTRQTIGMIEAGKFNPSLALCLGICRVLDKTLNDLFWEEESP